MKLGCGEYFTNWLSTSSFNKFWKFFELWIHLKLGGSNIRGHDMTVLEIGVAICSLYFTQILIMKMHIRLDYKQVPTRLYIRKESIPYCRERK
jgi:hypothetical protein